MERPAPPYAPSHHRFVLPATQKTFSRQFSHVYVARLGALRESLLISGSSPPTAGERKVGKLIELGRVPVGGAVMVVGTLYKEQPGKPTPLDVFQADAYEKPPPSASQQEAMALSFASDKDGLVMEDESGRVQLDDVPREAINQLVTGVILGVRGVVTPKGALQVKGFVFPPSFPPPALPAPAALPSTTPVYVALVTDLGLGGANELTLEVNVLVDFLCGHLGDTDISPRIARVVVAGGTYFGGVHALPSPATNLLDNAIPGTASGDALVEPSRHADRLLSELASTVDVDVMPSIRDPTSNMALPQQPLHKCLFPHASRLSTFHRVTNPYAFSLDEVSFLGHAGEPLEDVLRNTTQLSLMDAAVLTVKSWRHLAPTAPDTLPCFPFWNEDPFVVPEQAPHVFFFAGPEFQTRLVDGTRFVQVPSFQRTRRIALLNVASPDLACVDFMMDVEV